MPGGARPFASVLNGNMGGVAATGERGLLEIMTVTHAGMTTDEFSRSVQEGIATARHRFALFHHDDAAREFAYDRGDKLQKFNVGWDEAVAKGWTVVSMRQDWKTVFPPVNK